MTEDTFNNTQKSVLKICAVTQHTHGAYFLRLLTLN